MTHPLDAFVAASVVLRTAFDVSPRDRVEDLRGFQWAVHRSDWRGRGEEWSTLLVKKPDRVMSYSLRVGTRREYDGVVAFRDPDDYDETSSYFVNAADELTGAAADALTSKFEAEEIAMTRWNNDCTLRYYLAEIIGRGDVTAITERDGAYRIWSTTLSEIDGYATSLGAFDLDVSLGVGSPSADDRVVPLLDPPGDGP